MTESNWPIVKKFAKEMEAKLESNRHKGDRETWRKSTPESILVRLEEELMELEEEIDFLKLHPRDVAVRRRIVHEAADIANFALIIADICGGLDDN